MDPYNPVIRLCVKGTRAEFEGRKNDARELYLQAWNAVTEDYEASIAAHYVARCQDSLGEVLHWNQLALERAEAVKDGRVKDFYPSLYLSLGHAHELLGNQAEAKKYYDLATGLGVPHQPDQ